MSKYEKVAQFRGSTMDKTPKGNSPEGFFDRDTGTRPVALLHPANTKAAERMQKNYDVYIWRMTPPDAAYIVPRDQWDETHQRMMESLERYLGDS